MAGDFNVHGCIQNVQNQQEKANILMEQLGECDDSAQMLGLSMELMVQQQKVAIQTESINKTLKSNHDGQNSAIKSIT